MVISSPIPSPPIIAILRGGTKTFLDRPPECNKPSDDNIASIKIYEHFIAGANIQISSSAQDGE